MVVLTGGGTRSRHIYSIGLELGMPTGIIAKFGSSPAGGGMYAALRVFQMRRTRMPRPQVARGAYPS